MSRDGDIVFEIVTTKYKFAELNRQRKFRFLCGVPINKKELTRSGSTPALPKMDEAEFKKPLDLSVPGTPVSSRYVAFMRKKGNFIEDSEDEDLDESEKPKMARMVDDKVLNESLKKFLADMNSLEENEPKKAEKKPFEEYFMKSDEQKSYSSNFEVAESEISVAPAEKIKNPKIEQYFEESKRRNSFKRDFTEVYQEVKKKDQFTDLSVPGTPISSRYITLKPVVMPQDIPDNGASDSEIHQKFESKEMIKQISELTSAIVGLSYEEKEEKVSTENPRVTQFFQEAEAKKTYRLSYNEALLQAETNPDGLDSSNVKKLDISVPGTPVSSRHLFAAKNKNLLDADGNSSEISEYEVIDLPDSEEVKYLAQKLVAEIENLVAKNDAATAEQEEASDGSIEILNKSEAVTPNTPKSLEVEILITKPDETDDIEESSVDPSFVSKQEFHEIFEDHDLQTINEVDEPSQGKTESKDYDNSESSLTPATSTVSLEQDQDLINLELHEDKSQPSKVQEYFQSADNGSYQRGFSEVEKFNEIPQANKEKIEEYFEASKEKQTLQRTFSQALNYVPPKISIEELLVPGCPISSSQVIEMKVCGKKSDDVDAGAEKIITPKVEEKSAPLLVDEYFNKSEERKTYKLDFSEAFKELGNTNQKKNPEIEKYFDESKGKSFKRSFSQAVQHIEPSVNKILVSQQKKVENGVLDYLKPGTPISSADVCKSDKSVEIEMKVKKSVVNDDTLHISEEIPKKAPLKVDDYFQESLERNTYRREISEAFQEIGNVEKKKNPEIEKYLDTSTTQKSFQRSFSEAAQEMAPSINKILVDSPKTDSTELKDLHELRDNQRSRTSSIGSDSSRAHGKKLGIDKFFATSLYRNAYHRSPLPVADDIGGDANELSILEDDDLVAQLDGDTRDSKQDGVGLLIEDDIRSNISEGGQKQDATFWRELLKSERE